MNKRTKTALAVVFLVLLVAGSVWILCFRGTARLRVAEGPVFGTLYHIKYECAEPLDSQIVVELRRVDASLSVFNPASTVSRINTGATARADEMLREVLSRSLEVSRATGGAFDVTVMPLVNAWGFGFKKGEFPTDAAVDSLRAFVGYRLVSLCGDSVAKGDPRVMLDFGAIAKGYGVDRVARLLREHGVRNYMVEIGGEVVAKGRNPDGRPWQIGVSKPVEGGGDGIIEKVVELSDGAVATSGNYRNFYERDGRKYAHTIDPRTGRPVRHSLLSATVMARDCATADAYATAFMVMGLDSAAAVVKGDKSLRAIFIYSDAQGKMRVKEVE